MRALVTDAHLRSAVAGVRGLGRGGIRSLAVAPRRSAAGMWSRYVDGRAKAPDPALDPAGFVAALGALAAEHGEVVVYPSSEAGLEPLLRHPLPRGVRLPFDDIDAVERLRDKARLADLGEAAGFRAPRVLAAGTAADIRTAAPAAPFVLKPSIAPAGIATAHVVESAGRLERLLTQLGPGDRVIAQERVDGTPVSLALVVDQAGEVVGRFQERVLRTWPAAAGSFSLTQSEAPDARLVDSARTLLADAGYSGLAQLDLILTDSGPVLLDVNTRFYACLPTALRCGVNLPALWHGVVHGWPFPSAPADYPTGVRFRWLEADMSAVINGAPARLATLPRRGTAGAMWASDDPAPAALLAWDAVRIRAARRLRRG